MDDDATLLTRLHITPLDPDLLKVVIPSAVLPRAANISYHTIECFPEKRYGFVDLPPAEADKLKKKLNGAVLRGCKIRIEKARPDDMPRPSEDAVTAPPASSESGQLKEPRGRDKDKARRSSKDKKRKRGGGEEIVGIELEEGRKVKRGWTVPESAKATERRTKDKRDKKAKKEKSQHKKEARSRYTDGPECLIKTVLPASFVEGDDGKGDSTEGRPKKRKGKAKSETVIIHEFEKTTKFPTFLKSSNATAQSKASSSTEFVEGVGWVDEDGNVVEPVHSSRRAAKPPKATSSRPSPPPPQPQTETGDVESTTGDSGSSSSDETDDDRAEGAGPESLDNGGHDGDVTGIDIAPPKLARPLPSPISIPPASSPSENPKVGSGGISSVSKTDSPRPKSASSVRSLTIKIPPTTPAPPKVHPLEALYKRPKPADGETPSRDAASGEKSASSSFAFFDAEDAEEQEDEEDEKDQENAPRGSQSQAPMTPFTRHDMELRHMRSAAPTPDTAYHNRSFKFWPPAGSQETVEEGDEGEEGEDNNDEGSSPTKDEEEDDHGDITSAVSGGARHSTTTGSDAISAAAASQPQTSDFQKWFWENRGDLNRSWKKRRKLASKDKRYRDNKSRASRAI